MVWDLLFQIIILLWVTFYLPFWKMMVLISDTNVNKTKIQIKRMHFCSVYSAKWKRGCLCRGSVCCQVSSLTWSQPVSLSSLSLSLALSLFLSSLSLSLSLSLFSLLSSLSLSLSLLSLLSLALSLSLFLSLSFSLSFSLSLFLSLSLSSLSLSLSSLSLGCHFLNVVCSTCRPVTHRSPTRALAPFIRAEEDRWTSGLRTLSVKTDGPRPCTATRNATWDSIRGIQNLHSTSAFETITWGKKQNGETIKMWEYCALELFCDRKI